MDSGDLFPPGIHMIDAARVGAYTGANRALLDSILDEFGTRSAAAQGIGQPMTSAAKLVASEHRVYLASDGAQLTGFLKVGTKHLYYYDRKGKVQELDPVCALDFFVDEGCQRRGIGNGILQGFLEVRFFLMPLLLIHNATGHVIFPWLPSGAYSGRGS